jgi:hypothetical protein
VDDRIIVDDIRAILKSTNNTDRLLGVITLCSYLPEKSFNPQELDQIFRILIDFSMYFTVNKVVNSRDFLGNNIKYRASVNPFYHTLFEEIRVRDWASEPTKVGDNIIWMRVRRDSKKSRLRSKYSKMTIHKKVLSIGKAILNIYNTMIDNPDYIL